MNGEPTYWTTRRRLPGPVLLSFFSLALCAACGGDSPDAAASDGGGSGQADGSSSGTPGDGGDGGNSSSTSANGPGSADAAPGSTTRALAIEPADPLIDSDGSPQTLQLGATLDGQPLESTNWSVSGSPLGHVDEDGVFHTDGRVAGRVRVTARFGDLSATTEVHIRVAWQHVEDDVSSEQRTALEGDAEEDPDFAWLYPYEDTVFPRGLPAPFMQFGGGDAEALRISLQTTDFSYEGFFPASSPAGITLPQEVWDALTQSADGSEPVTVEVRKLAGGEAIGPARRQLRIAPAELRGTVYYNTYNSVEVGTGAVMRIRPGEQAEVLHDGCTVCHSVSANGNALAAGVGWDDGNPVDSAVFDLLDDGSSPPRFTNTDGRIFSFAGLTADGSKLISNGIPPEEPRVRGLGGTLASALYDAETGEIIEAPSFTEQVQYAITPNFSLDASKLAFNWWEHRQGRDLAVMDVDLTTSPPSFAEPQVVASVDEGIVGWPSFLPDGNGLLYDEGDHFDTARYGGQSSYAELRMVDLESLAIHELEALNGWRDGTSYLPYGEDEENHRNYEPSVLPLPVGGYYWVLFTSRRAYGHTLAPGGTVAGSGNEWGEHVDGAEVPSPRKKLWLAAIDVNYQGSEDPSHPALYLPGQELEAGNMRAYAALNPCLQLGESCESGADCCEGFCRTEGDVGGAVCVVPPPTCSFTDEACNSDADCCRAPQGEVCINNRCAQSTPILQ